MVGISVTIDMDDLSGLAELDEERITEWIEARLNEARNLFIRHVSRGGGGGRTYRRGRRGTHTASAPGEYPVTDSGRLVNSIDYEMEGPRRGTIYATVEYAKYLKEGTTRGLAPRKMLQEAVDEAKRNNPLVL